MMNVERPSHLDKITHRHRTRVPYVLQAVIVLLMIHVVGKCVTDRVKGMIACV